MARQPQWGSKLDAKPGQAFTMDFQDSDGDGVDDRMQRGPGQPRGKVGQDYGKANEGGNNNSGGFPEYDQGNQGATMDTYNRGSRDARMKQKQDQSQQGQQGQQGLDQGYMNFSDIMGQFFNYKPGDTDDEGRVMKNAMMGDWMSKFFDSRLSKEMGQYQAGLAKDMMNQQWNLEQMGQSNARKEEFGYGMRAMDKQYELQNQYANQQYGRDIGTLSATGEQTRKNYRAQGIENRLQSIVQNEQERLNIGARGDQERLNIDRRGDNERQAIVTTGRQERKNIGARGEQERLNIGARGDQERKTMDFGDRINAGRENRQRGRAKALARSF